MANEDNSGFDAGQMYDEGVAEAGLEETTEEAVESSDAGVMTQEGEPAEKSPPVKTEEAPGPAQDDEAIQSALSSTEEGEQKPSEEEEPESVIAQILPKTEPPESKPEQRVPLDEHIKLRQRAQAAERERDELREQLKASETPTGGAKPGEAEEEKSPVEQFVEENPDEDFVPAKVQAEQLKWDRQQLAKRAEAQAQAQQKAREEAEKQQSQIAAVQELGRKANESEKAARKANPDYEVVTKAALAANLVRPQDVQALLKTDDIAGNLYKLAKERLTAIATGLGQPPPAPKTTQPTAPKPPGAEDEELTDEQIAEDLDKELWQAG